MLDQEAVKARAVAALRSALASGTGPGASGVMQLQPRTAVGQWMLAALLNQREERNRRSKTLNGGVNGRLAATSPRILTSVP
ncbi:MAG: hypothetical protein M3Y33_13720 [Actinomycetota bacterium]|nr:hypothetical protein [Actinomycetota bacterium]